MTDYPKKLVFVGGAPRSGTTVTHALICTSRSVGSYHPEVSFLRPLVMAYRSGKIAWTEHTHAFFQDHEAFRRHMRKTLDVSIDHLWRLLDSPEVLAMKDPMMTPMFRDLHELFAGDFRFVTVCRHPYAVVRSRQAVHDRTGQGRPFGLQDVANVAQEYVNFYQSVLGTNFGGRHYMFRYEDLNEPRIRQGLMDFVGVDDFDTDLLWKTKDDLRPTDDQMLNDAWGSPKYLQAIDLEPRFEPLDDEWAEATKQICQPIMTRMGYD